MDNNVFYVWDNHRKVWASNPDMQDQTEWFVWDPHTWWEFNSSLIKGIEFFPRAEIYRGVRPPNASEMNFADDRRKKVAILFYEQIKRRHGTGQLADIGPIEDYPLEISDVPLNWADIVITFSMEPMQSWWPRIYSDINYAVHHDKIKCVFASHMPYTDPPPDRFYTKQLSFFNYVVNANHHRDINQQNVPFRKYMFDILIGTVKTARLYLMYRLLESDFLDQCLVNLQPSPYFENTELISQIDPEGFAKYGTIDHYQSPGLADLEEPVVTKFKEDTKDLDAKSQYSVNLVDRPGFDIPGDNIPMSCIMPWAVYQSSWYSVVCETSDIGEGTFLTEKTAKCLFGKRIFIMFGSAGLLKRLRSLGFRSFHSDVIDEGYDDELDDKKRYEMAWAQITRLKNTEDPRSVYSKLKDVIEHNYNLIVSLPLQQLADIQQFIHTPFALEQTKM
jgi:hypothetical protein